MTVLSSNFDFQNFFETTLNGDITAGTLTIDLTTVPSPSEGILIINPDGASPEAILYTSKGVNSVTCPADGRGWDSTTAQPWTSGTTVIMAPVGYMFRAIKTGELAYNTPLEEATFDYVASGCVWSGDSYGSTRNASMTAGVVYINGLRITVSSVTARSFTASKDTYIDVGSDGVIDYTEVSNNAASPALSADHIRIGIIVTGASNIANVGSVNQGQEDKVLPVASSTYYTVTDSLGNLICPRDPLRKVIGFRQSLTEFTTSSAAPVQRTGLSVPCIIPDGRKIQITYTTANSNNTSAGATVGISVYDGTVSGTPLHAANQHHGTAAAGIGTCHKTPPLTLSPGLHTINSALCSPTGAGTAKDGTPGSGFYNYVMVELV